MAPPYRPRRFVWCQFPYNEEPLRPGPKEHVGYVADIRHISGNAHLTVMSLYTTSVPWEPSVRLPPGIIPVERKPPCAITLRPVGVRCVPSNRSLPL